MAAGAVWRTRQRRAGERPAASRQRWRVESAAPCSAGWIGGELSCSAVLEFPRPRGCGAPGVRRIRRPSRGQRRKLIIPDLVDRFPLPHLLIFSLAKEVGPCRTACSFSDRGGRAGARAPMRPCLPPPPGVHEWILPHGTCPLCSPRHHVQKPCLAAKVVN